MKKMQDYNVLPLSANQSRNIKGGWALALFGIAVGAYIALAHYAHEKHH